MVSVFEKSLRPCVPASRIQRKTPATRRRCFHLSWPVSGLASQTAPPSRATRCTVVTGSASRQWRRLVYRCGGSTLWTAAPGGGAAAWCFPFNCAHDHACRHQNGRIINRTRRRRALLGLAMDDDNASLPWRTPFLRSHHAGRLAHFFRLPYWSEAPYGRLAHPREDHRMPLMVTPGAAEHARQGALNCRACRAPSWPLFRRPQRPPWRLFQPSPARARPARGRAIPASPG